MNEQRTRGWRSARWWTWVCLAVLLAVRSPAAEPRGKTSIDDDVLRVRKLHVIAIALRDITTPWQHSAGPGRNLRESQLSWRVHLLPQLGLVELYDKFALDEPWDSEQNRALLDDMPEIYALGRTRGGLTQFRVHRGPHGILGWSGRKFLEDDPSGTVAVYVCDQKSAVAWTRPDPMVDDFEHVRRDLQLPARGAIEVGMLDGAILRLTSRFPQESLAALFTPRGSEWVDPIGLQRRFGLDWNGESVHRADWSMSDLLLARSGLMNAIRMQSETRYLRQTGADGAAFPVSWRVEILPYIGCSELYEQYRFDQPWDSEENKQLLAQMPEIYRTPQSPDGSTRLRIFRTFDQIRLEDFRSVPAAAQASREVEGGAQQQSLLAVIVGESKAVPWTSPEPLVPAGASLADSVGLRPGETTVGIRHDQSFVQIRGDSASVPTAAR